MGTSTHLDNSVVGTSTHLNNITIDTSTNLGNNADSDSDENTCMHEGFSKVLGSDIPDMFYKYAFNRKVNDLDNNVWTDLLKNRNGRYLKYFLGIMFLLMEWLQVTHTVYLCLVTMQCRVRRKEQ